MCCLYDSSIAWMSATSMCCVLLCTMVHGSDLVRVRGRHSSCEDLRHQQNIGPSASFVFAMFVDASWSGFAFGERMCRDSTQT